MGLRASLLDRPQSKRDSYERAREQHQLSTSFPPNNPAKKKASQRYASSATHAASPSMDTNTPRPPLDTTKACPNQFPMCNVSTRWDRGHSKRQPTQHAEGSQDVPATYVDRGTYAATHTHTHLRSVRKRHNTTTPWKRLA